MQKSVGNSTEQLLALNHTSSQKGSVTTETVTLDSEDEDDDDEEDYFDELPVGTAPDPAGVSEPITTNFQKFQHKLRILVEHVVFRLFGMLLIVVDVVIVVVELVQLNEEASVLQPYEWASLGLASYFVAEVSLRLLALGTKEFFTNCFHTIDLVIVLCTFVINILCALVDLIDIPGEYKLVVAGRLIRIVMFVRLYTEKKHVEKGARHLVSQNKRRYQKDGFDLDLTYVTERVIAMSFPSAGKMSVYRNPIGEVARFLNAKHPAQYKVYNLCSEATYDETYFQGRVERYYIDDHNVPLLRDMVKFSESARLWLSEDPNNVIAVHCKGGKGRTGTMICVWLVECGLFRSAGASLDYFGNRRTDLSVGTKFQGVETPSQSRYVGYYERMKERLGGRLPQVVPLILHRILITALAGVGKGDGSDFRLEIFLERTHKVFECDFGSHTNCQVVYFGGAADYMEATISNCPCLTQDVKLKFHCSSRNVPKGYEKVPLYLWFHTSFVENMTLHLKRDQLDNPHKSKTWQWFRERFSIQLHFIPPHSDHVPIFR